MSGSSAESGSAFPMSMIVVVMVVVRDRLVMMVGMIAAP